MRYLADANVLSEPTRSSPDPRVVAWLREHEDRLVVDPFVVGELHAGVLALPAGRRRRGLEDWFRRVVRSIECLPFDAASALTWSRLVTDLRRRGTPVPLLDSLIAATALTHGLTVATRNARDFRPTGVPVVDPFA
jgi:predicted nucleic acid-binding protein